ncbi:hypothetical protein BDZ91DRAFT_768403 [Kalaharituber pfeilii]|nr:hypothetical protein BDZ91DRAFT_768403 [Kalaharituber pfeilii]
MDLGVNHFLQQSKFEMTTISAHVEKTKQLIYWQLATNIKSQSSCLDIYECLTQWECLEKEVQQLSLFLWKMVGLSEAHVVDMDPIKPKKLKSTVQHNFTLPGDPSLGPMTSSSWVPMCYEQGNTTTHPALEPIQGLYLPGLPPVLESTRTNISNIMLHSNDSKIGIPPNLQAQDMEAQCQQNFVESFNGDMFMNNWERSPSASAREPVNSRQYKYYNCPFPECTSSGQKRSDNLREHYKTSRSRAALANGIIMDYLPLLSGYTYALAQQQALHESYGQASIVMPSFHSAYYYLYTGGSLLVYPQFESRVEIPLARVYRMN